MTTLALSIALQASLLTASGHPYQAAYSKTCESGKPLLVLVGADWCPGCRTMKNSVIPELQRHGRLSKVEYAEVNTDQQKALAGKLLKGNSIPQLIMFEKVGTKWTRKQLIGAQSTNETGSFVARAKQAQPPKAAPQ